MSLVTYLTSSLNIPGSLAGLNLLYLSPTFVWTFWFWFLASSLLSSKLCLIWFGFIPDTFVWGFLILKFPEVEIYLLVFLSLIGLVFLLMGTFFLSDNFSANLVLPVFYFYAKYDWTILCSIVSCFYLVRLKNTFSSGYYF